MRKPLQKERLNSEQRISVCVVNELLQNKNYLPLIQKKEFVQHTNVRCTAPHFFDARQGVPLVGCRKKRIKSTIKSTTRSLLAPIF